MTILNANRSRDRDTARGYTVEDVRAYYAITDTIKRGEIAAHQAWLLSKHLGPREKKLRLIDARARFLQMRDES